MLRFVGNCLAPLASLKPVLAVSVESQNTLRRLIGRTGDYTPNVAAINSVVEKTRGQGLAGQTALVARALVYLNGRNPTATVSEIDSVLPQISDETLKCMAIGIRLRAHNDLLDLKETALHVSGGATEAEVSDLRSKAQRDYTALRACSPGCWLVSLATAEYNLYIGNTEEAFGSLVEVENKIQTFLDAPVELTEEVATPENTNPYSLLGFLLHRSYLKLPVKVSPGKIVSEALDAVGESTAVQKALAAFKEEMGGQLTDSEALELALTLHAASVRHHFHDFFPEEGEYSNWTSTAAKAASDAVMASKRHCIPQLPEGTLEKVKAARPRTAFYGSEEKLRGILKTPSKDKSILDTIRETFGPMPDVPLSREDESYFDALASVTGGGASPATAGTTAYSKDQKSVSKVVARQLLYRTQVQKGVALTEMNRLHEAVDAITPVVMADEYIYMWRAFMARSRAYKGLGLITKADKDIKALKDLKRTLTEHPPYEMV